MHQLSIDPFFNKNNAYAAKLVQFSDAAVTNERRRPEHPLTM